MKITVCPADDGGCGHYRITWPARTLISQGHDIEIVDHESVWVGPAPGGRVVAAIGPPPKFEDGLYRISGDMRDLDCDVLVIQRPLDKARAEAIPLAQSLGIAVVVEIDDDFSCIDPRNAAHDAAQPENNPDHNWRWLARAAELADMVTVSTPALARRFAPHGRFAIVPNCVPGRYLHERREAHKGVAVGWSGAVSTHPGDLESTGGGVGRAVGGFHVIGTGQGVQEALGLARRPSATNWVALADYPHHLAQLDVGIVPLRACAFNRAKSWLKGLEMAAVGAAFVASRTPEYERLAKLGAGVLAVKPADWEREVRRLVRDPGWRAEVARRGKDVATELTIEKNAWRWLAAWSEAAVMRKAA